jgi:hypothetical protein
MAKVISISGDTLTVKDCENSIIYQLKWRKVYPFHKQPKHNYQYNEKREFSVQSSGEQKDTEGSL